MKAVLMSIHPKWSEKIFNGEKTIEVRKTVPKLETPFTVYVYQTKTRNAGNAFANHWSDCLELPNGEFVNAGGKVIGSFVCDKITCCQAYYGNSGEGHLTNLFGAECKCACFSEQELFDYIIGNGGKMGTGWLWRIAEPKLFDKPKALGEFYTKCDKTGDETCGDCLYLQVMLNSYPCDDSVDTWCGVDNKKPISCAPQSWCYVEEQE